MCSNFPNTFSRGTVQKFRDTLVCLGTPSENPWSKLTTYNDLIMQYNVTPYEADYGNDNMLTSTDR
jgi:hypothetical protein